MAVFSGIDVSKYQGEINWNLVKESGVQFAMIRASYGVDGVDEKFFQNAENAKAAGIDCGAYHYLYAATAEGARQEARHFLQTVKGQEMKYPLALDLEYSPLGELAKDALTELATAFLEVLEEANYYAILYTEFSWLRDKLDLQRLAPYDIWLAEWAETPNFRGEFGMWQYTSQGTAPGILTRVDKDLAYKDYPEIIKRKGLNHLEPEAEDWKVRNVALALERGILKNNHSPDEIVDMGTACTIANNLYDVLRGQAALLEAYDNNAGEGVSTELQEGKRE